VPSKKLTGLDGHKREQKRPTVLTWKRKKMKGEVGLIPSVTAVRWRMGVTNPHEGENQRILLDHSRIRRCAHQKHLENVSTISLVNGWEISRGGRRKFGYLTTSEKRRSRTTTGGLGSRGH